MRRFFVLFCFLLSAFAFQPDHAQGKVCGYRQPAGLGYVGTGCSIDSKGVATCDADCTEIENYAFQDEAVLSVDFSNTSITFIDKFAFNRCSSLRTVTLPSTLTSLGTGVFTACSSLQTITFPSSLTTIGQGVFTKCTSLQAIDLSNTSIASIGRSAFQACSSLETIDLSNTTSLSTIEQDAFKGIADPSKITVTRGSYAHETLGENGTSTESGGAINSTYADAQTKLDVAEVPTPTPTPEPGEPTPTPAPKSGAVEEIRVVPLPEDAFGSYEVDPVTGEKNYLMFNTYAICMDFLNNEELCSGYERCYHK